MINILASTLSELGFKELEVTLYERFLTDKNINFSALAIELNLDRSFIYKALKSLENGGLITKKERGNYHVESPSKLIAMLKLRETKTKSLLQNLNENLPELNNRFQKTYKTIGTKVYEGREQFINLMNQVLAESPKEILYYGNSSNQIKLVDSDFQKEWSLMRAKKGIKTKMLAFKDKNMDWFADRNKEQNRELKYLPENHKCEGFYWVYNQTVIQWNPVLPKAVLTEDRIISDTLRSIFETLWDTL